MTITAIRVNGTALDFNNVDVTLGINHGRSDITSQGQASDASLTIRNFATIPGQIGQSLVIECFGATRFTGFITQLALSHQYSPSGQLLPVLQINGLGNMSRLGLAYVGASGYAKENLEARVIGILNDTGLVYQANVSPNMELAALAAQTGGYSAMSLLTDLCAQTGATMCDLPDGTILWENYSNRGVGYNPAHWYDIVPTDTWTDIPFIWSDVYDSTEAAPLTVELPHNAVVWSPTWRNDILTVVNEVTVEYGNNNSTTQTDAPSQTKYGRRAFRLSTKLTKLSDAQTRAGDIIRAQAEPRYALTNVLVQVDQLTTLQKAQVLGLISGSRVSLPNTPQPSPLEDYEGVVEGWSDHYGADGYFLSISLSDPRYSYQVLKWNEVTAGKTWSQVDPTVQWYNVVQNADLF